MTAPARQVAHMLPPMARKRLTSVERRAQIADAACTVMVTRGVHAFRLRDVADEAGVSQPLVSAHFASRDELILAAFETSDERAYDLIVRYARPARNGRERLVACVLGCLRLDPEIVEAWDLWHQLWALGRYSPASFERLRTRQATWIELAARTVREGQADGSIDDDVDPARSGVLLMTLIDGVTPAQRAGLVDVGTAREIVSDAIETTLRRSPALLPVR